MAIFPYLAVRKSQISLVSISKTPTWIFSMISPLTYFYLFLLNSISSFIYFISLVSSYSIFFSSFATLSNRKSRYWTYLSWYSESGSVMSVRSFFNWSNNYQIHKFSSSTYTPVLIYKGLGFSLGKTVSLSFSLIIW